MVVDGGSSDKTVEIALSFNAKVFIETNWQGFGIQKQRALDCASLDWVISIDADEVVTDNLREEIAASIRNTSMHGFYLNRMSNFLGTWMKHGGWYPDYVLRLGRKKSAQFTDSIVHEKLMINGAVGLLKNALLHYSYPTIESVLVKQLRYALASSDRKSKSGYRGSIIGATIRALLRFITDYVIRAGFLDGKSGFLAAAARSQEVFWKYVLTSYSSNS